MKAEFEQRYKELEQKREQLFKDLKAYSDETINRLPDSNSWSVAEVIGHLMSAERATLSYLKKKTLDTSRSKNAGLSNKLKYNLLKMLFSVPLKFKAPKVTTPIAKYSLLLEMDIEWAAIRRDTNAIIAKLDEKDFKKELWLHPVSGKMNLLQMVNFTHIHFDRHKKQIEKTLKAIT